MSEIVNCIKEIMLMFLAVYGFGLILKWFATMIAWGAAEGWAKIPKNISLSLGKITIVLGDKTNNNK